MKKQPIQDGIVYALVNHITSLHIMSNHTLKQGDMKRQQSETYHSCTGSLTVCSDACISHVRLYPVGAGGEDARVSCEEVRHACTRPAAETRYFS